MFGQQLNWSNISVRTCQQFTVPLRCQKEISNRMQHWMNVGYFLAVIVYVHAACEYMCACARVCERKEIRFIYAIFCMLNIFMSKARKLGQSIYAYTGCHVCDDICALSLLFALTHSCSKPTLFVRASASVSVDVRMCVFTPALSSRLFASLYSMPISLSLSRTLLLYLFLLIHFL